MCPRPNFRILNRPYEFPGPSRIFRLYKSQFHWPFFAFRVRPTSLSGPASPAHIQRLIPLVYVAVFLFWFPRGQSSAYRWISALPRCFAATERGNISRASDIGALRRWVESLRECANPRAIKREPFTRRAPSSPYTPRRCAIDTGARGGWMPPECGADSRRSSGRGFGPARRAGPALVKLRLKQQA